LFLRFKFSNNNHNIYLLVAFTFIVSGLTRNHHFLVL
jgi:hypothetical protein